MLNEISQRKASTEWYLSGVESKKLNLQKQRVTWWIQGDVGHGENIDVSQKTRK